MIYYVVLGLVVNLILAATSSEKTASIHIPIKGGNIMWCEWMDEFEESEREEMKRIKEEMELKDKIFRISHPVLAKLNDAKMQLGRKILGL